MNFFFFFTHKNQCFAFIVINKFLLLHFSSLNNVNHLIYSGELDRLIFFLDL